MWKDSSSLWPIPKGWDSTAIHTVLNNRWKTLKDRYQWNNALQSLWSKNIEPKKSCLAWLIAFRAIWTNKKALKREWALPEMQKSWGRHPHFLPVWMYCPRLGLVQKAHRKWRKSNLDSQKPANWRISWMLKWPMDGPQGRDTLVAVVSKARSHFWRPQRRLWETQRKND